MAGIANATVMRTVPLVRVQSVIVILIMCG